MRKWPLVWKTQSCNQMALRGKGGGETKAHGSSRFSQGPSYSVTLSHLCGKSWGHMKGPGGTAFLRAEVTASLFPYS